MEYNYFSKLIDILTNNVQLYNQVNMLFEFPVQKSTIRQACITVQDELRTWRVPENTAQEVVLAIDEALTNIWEHGYKKSGFDMDAGISLNLELYNSEIKVEIKDQASQYSFEDVKSPEMEGYVASNLIGGFGIAIIRNIMDSVELNHVDGTNILTLTKQIFLPPQDGSIVISTDTSEAWVCNKILMVNTKPGAKIDIVEARKNVWAYADMVNRYPQNMVYAKIIDQVMLRKITWQAIRYYMDHEHVHILAIGLIRSSVFERLFLNFFIFSRKKKRAVKIFKYQKDAIKWVEKFQP